MNEWARKDARRALRRLEHLRQQDEPADSDECAYLAASLRTVLYGVYAHTLPPWLVGELREVMERLEPRPRWVRVNGNGNGDPGFED